MCMPFTGLSCTCLVASITPRPLIHPLPGDPWVWPRCAAKDRPTIQRPGTKIHLTLTFAINGVTFAINGVTFAINGVTFAINGVTFAINGVTFAIDGVTEPESCARAIHTVHTVPMCPMSNMGGENMHRPCVARTC